MSAGVFAGTNRIPTPGRANGTGTGAISWPYCLAADKLGCDPREVKPSARAQPPPGAREGRIQLRPGMEKSKEATTKKANTLSDFDMNRSSYFHISMAQPYGPAAFP